MKNFCRLRSTFCQDILTEASYIEDKRMDILRDSVSKIIVGSYVNCMND